MKKRKKRNLFPFFTYFSKYFLLFFVFLALISFPDKSRVAQKLAPTKNYYQKPQATKVTANLKYITPTPAPFAWKVEKVDDHITAMTLPPDPRMSTSDELFDAMNEYRKANGIPTLSKNSTLCSIAQNRANEQLANGDLDDHAGFDKYAQNQQEFSRMGEVLFGGVQPQYGVHIVEFGWNRSLTGHKEAISDPSWQAGCGGIAGYYAVFIFGSN